MTTLLPVAGDDGGWATWSPMAAIAPVFGSERGGGEDASLRIAGGGNRHVFGAWTRRVPARPGTAYRLRVAFRCHGIESLELHVTPHIVWRRGERPEEQCAADAVRHF